MKNVYSSQYQTTCFGPIMAPQLPHDDMLHHRSRLRRHQSDTYSFWFLLSSLSPIAYWHRITATDVEISTSQLIYIVEPWEIWSNLTMAMIWPKHVVWYWKEYTFFIPTSCVIDYPSTYITYKLRRKCCLWAQITNGTIMHTFQLIYSTNLTHYEHLLI